MKIIEISLDEINLRGCSLTVERMAYNHEALDESVVQVRILVPLPIF